MCSNTRELINLHQKSFIYCDKLNKLIKCSVTMALNYHAIQVMWCKHIPRPLSGIISVSQSFCTCTYKWIFVMNRMESQCSLFCFVLFKVCMCVMSIYVYMCLHIYSKVQLTILLIFTFLILASFMVQQSFPRFYKVKKENCSQTHILTERMAI